MLSSQPPDACSACAHRGSGCRAARRTCRLRRRQQVVVDDGRHVEQCDGAGHAAARLLPERHPRPGASSASQKGIFAASPGPERQARDQDLQRRPRGRRGAVRRRASTPPTSARTRPSTPTRSPTARPCASSPARPRAAPSSSSSPSINERGRPQGQEDRHAAARQHPGRRAAHLAQAARACTTDTTGGGDVLDRARRTTRTRSTASRPATSTAPGCPSRGRPASSQEGGGKVLVDEADLWPEGQFVTTAARSSRTEVPRRPPRRRQEADRGPDRRRSTTINDEPGRRPRRSSTRQIEKITGKALNRTRGRRGLEEHDVHHTTRSRRRCRRRPTGRQGGRAARQSADLKGIFDLTCSTRS